MWIHLIFWFLKYLKWVKKELSQKMLSLNLDWNLFSLDVCSKGIKCLNWMRCDMKTAEIINVATLARWRRPRFAFRLRPQGRGTPEHRENHRLLRGSQRPAGVGAVMGKPPGTGPSGPGRITEQKEKGDFAQSKSILEEGRSFCLPSELLYDGRAVCACGQREETTI